MSHARPRLIARRLTADFGGLIGPGCARGSTARRATTRSRAAPPARRGRRPTRRAVPGRRWRGLHRRPPCRLGRPPHRDDARAPPVAKLRGGEALPPSNGSGCDVGFGREGGVERCRGGGTSRGGRGGAAGPVDAMVAGASPGEAIGSVGVAEASRRRRRDELGGPALAQAGRPEALGRGGARPRWAARPISPARRREKAVRG